MTIELTKVPIAAEFHYNGWGEGCAERGGIEELKEAWQTLRW